jgi:hypothetical protein
VTAKLARKLRREFKANPKKGIALGILFVIAGYFWAPMLSGWLGMGSAQPPPAAGTMAAAPAADVSPATVKPNGPATPARSWRELAKSIDDDPRMRPADATAERDPFHSNAVELTEQDTLEAFAARQPAITPADAGIVLSSTIVGPTQRVARVAGTTYRVGDRIRTGRDGRGVEFVVAQIEPRSVVLMRDGHRYEVKLKRPQGYSKVSPPPTESESDADSDSDDDIDVALGLDAGHPLDEVDAKAMGLLEPSNPPDP